MFFVSKTGPGSQVVFHLFYFVFVRPSAVLYVGIVFFFFFFFHCTSMLLISSVGNTGRLHFVVVAFSGYLHL